MTNEVISNIEAPPTLPVGAWVYRVATVLALLTVAAFIVLGHGSV